MTETTRTITLPNGDTVVLHRPGMQDHEDADFKYSAMFNKAIKNGIVPREVMKQELREQGIWTEEDDMRSEQLEEEIAYAMAALQNTADDDDRDEFNEARLKVTKLRADYMVHNGRLSSFMTNCAEEKANEARLLYLAYACAKKEDGKPYWKSYDLFRTCNVPGVVNSVFVNFMLFMNNMTTNIDAVLPENQVKLKSERKVAEVLDKVVAESATEK